MFDELSYQWEQVFHQLWQWDIPIIATCLWCKLYGDGGLIGRDAGRVFEVLERQPRNGMMTVAIDRCIER